MVLRKIRIFDREPDYEASSVIIEADGITDPVKFRRSKNHHASQIDADGDAKVTVRSQYPNSRDKTRRPDAGTVITGDKITIDARDVDILDRSGSRHRASASRRVRIFKRRRGE